MSTINTNLKYAKIALGETFVIPEAFAAASITPNSDASTFTITNSQGNVSPSYGFQVNFPLGNNRSYASHIVECTAGSVIITYFA